MGKYGLLGYAVLVYALLTSGALRTVAQGRAGAVNGALWLVYVLGGFGLIRGKGWGRALTLLAAGGSLIAMVVILIVVGDLELLYFSKVWGLFGLPALAILVAARLVGLPSSKNGKGPPPTGTARKPRISKRALHDIAYGSFLVLGLIALWTSYWARVDPDPGVIGFMVIVPLGIPLLLALILGLGISIVLGRDARLITLMVLSIVMLVALNILGEAAWPLPLSLYAAVCMTIGLVWFVKYRRRFG